MWPFSKKDEEEVGEEDPEMQVGACPHLRVIYKCTACTGDTRPVYCSAQTCPARIQEELMIEARKGLYFSDYV